MEVDPNNLSISYRDPIHSFSEREIARGHAVTRQYGMAMRGSISIISSSNLLDISHLSLLKIVLYEVVIVYISVIHRYII